MLSAGLSHTLPPFAVGASVIVGLPARLPDLDVGPTVASVAAVGLLAWRPAGPIGLELGAEIGADWMLLADADGNPLHEPFLAPRTALRIGWNPPPVGWVEVEPFVRATWIAGRVELLSERNGDRDLSPWVVDVGAMLHFGRTKSAQ